LEGTCSLFALLDPKHACIYVPVRRLNDERHINKGYNFIKYEIYQKPNGEKKYLKNQIPYKSKIRVISGYHCCVNEIFDFLERYAT